MPTKFYFHDAVTTVGGTLPASGATVSGEGVNQVGDSGTNRSMTASIGVAQTSKAITTLAQTTAQNAVIARFVSPELAAQTIAANQVITFRCAASESSTNSDFFAYLQVVLWRPSTGAVVSRLWTAGNGINAPTEAGTTQTDTGAVTISNNSAQTVQAGDVLIAEVMRQLATQAMATGYTNTVFYDGTTEGSTTSNAAYLAFTNDVALSSGAAADPGFVHRRGPNYRR